MLGSPFGVWTLVFSTKILNGSREAKGSAELLRCDLSITFLIRDLFTTRSCQQQGVALSFCDATSGRDRVVKRPRIKGGQ